MSPQSKRVTAEGERTLVQKTRPWEIQVEDFFRPVERLKEAFAQLINCDSAAQIAVIPSASYGISTVANNLKLQRGQRIIIAAGQFPSNYYPWSRAVEKSGAELVTVSPPTGISRTQGWNQALLEAIDSRTALVSLGHIHWADGTRFDLKAIRKRTREVGAKMVIDGTQSVGALPFSIKELEPDALICAGYKWLGGPYGLGVAYYSAAMDDGFPIEENWINRHRSEVFSELLDYQASYRPEAAKYSMGGQSNFVMVPMLATAIEQLSEWGVANIQEYAHSLSAPAVVQMREMGIRVESESDRCGHLFGIRFPAGVALDAIQREFKEKNIYVSVRGNSVRISAHLYNRPRDFEVLLEAIKKQI